MALPIYSGPSSISSPIWWEDCSLLRPLLSWALQAESRCSLPVKFETPLYPTPSTGGKKKKTFLPAHWKSGGWEHQSIRSQHGEAGLPKNGASRTEGRARRTYDAPGTADVVDIQPYVGFIINPRRTNQSLQDSSLF